MELKRRFNFELVLKIAYFVVLTIYIIFCLNSVSATRIDAKLYIPSINLRTDVTSLELEHGELKTPDYIAGSFARDTWSTLLIGHSTTVFQNLRLVRTDDMIVYDGRTYRVDDIYVAEKSEISMFELLSSANENDLVLMTCSGEMLGDDDFTHRLIIKASAV